MDQQGSPYMLMMSLEHKGSSQSYPISWGLKEKLSGIFFSLKKLITAPLQDSMEDELGLRGSKYSAQCLAHRTSLIKDHFFSPYGPFGQRREAAIFAAKPTNT